MRSNFTTVDMNETMVRSLLRGGKGGYEGAGGDAFGGYRGGDGGNPGGGGLGGGEYKKHDLSSSVAREL